MRDWVKLQEFVILKDAPGIENSLKLQRERTRQSSKKTGKTYQVWDTYRMRVELRVVKTIEVFGGFLGRRIWEQGNFKAEEEEQVKRGGWEEVNNIKTEEEDQVKCGGWEEANNIKTEEEEEQVQCGGWEVKQKQRQ